MLVGVVAAIGIYAGAAGPFGAGLASLAAGLLGRLDVLLPPALVVAGVLVIVGPRRADVDLTLDHQDIAPDEYDADALDPHERHVALLRRVVGGVLAVLTVLGLLDVALGQDRGVEADGLDAFAEAGGLVGGGGGRAGWGGGDGQAGQTAATVDCGTRGKTSAAMRSSSSTSGDDWMSSSVMPASP